MFGDFALDYLIVHIGVDEWLALTSLHFVSVVGHTEQERHIQEEGHLENISQEEFRRS